MLATGARHLGETQLPRPVLLYLEIRVMDLSDFVKYRVLEGLRTSVVELEWSK